MLTIYRRHAKTCKHYDATNPQEFTRCGCPIWCYGWVNGIEVRKSMRGRDWRKALGQIDGWNKAPETALPAVTVTECVSAFIRDRQRRKMAQSTIDSHEKTFKFLRLFCGGQPVRTITIDGLSKYLESRDIAPGTSNKELKSLRALFAFAAKRGWAENVAKGVEFAKDDAQPTMPFTPDEVTALLDACDRLDDGNPKTRDLNRIKARARVLLFLYTGFRVSDTVQLRWDVIDLDKGQIFIAQQKTGVDKYSSIPEELVEALRKLPRVSPYVLWSGRSTMHSACTNARLSLQRLGKLAGVPNVHPHRFRDTFAIELLKNGETLHTVQLLLGHKSIKTTETHYAPYVLEIQAITDRAMAKLRFGNRTKPRTMDKEGKK